VRTLKIHNGESLLGRVTVLGLARCRQSVASVAATTLPKTNTRIVLNMTATRMHEWPVHPTVAPTMRCEDTLCACVEACKGHCNRESALEVETRCTLCAQRIQDGIMKSGRRSALEMGDARKDLQQLSTQGR
jgi:hypothetical protein